MQLTTLHRMLVQARELAAHNNTSLEASHHRRQAAELELAASQADEEVRAGSAQSTNDLVAALQERIQRHEAGAGHTGAAASTAPGDGGPASARAAVGGAIRKLLLAREEATTKEINQHIRQVLPDVNVRNTSPELTRLVQLGLLTRPRAGAYRLGGDWAVAERR